MTDKLTDTGPRVDLSTHKASDLVADIRAIGLTRAGVEDFDALHEAAARLQRREYGEALHYLAIALGPDFNRLETIRIGGEQ